MLCGYLVSRAYLPLEAAAVVVVIQVHGQIGEYMTLKSPFTAN